MNPVEYLRESAARFNNHIAVFDEHGSLSYFELNEAVEEVARQFSIAGMKPQSGVVLSGNNSREFIITAFAIMASGAVMMPISNLAAFNETKAMLKQVAISFFITDSPAVFEHHYYDYRPINIQNSVWHVYRIHDAEIPVAPFVPHSSFIRFTSGTTGKSKGVVLSNKTIDERTGAASEALQLSHNDTVMWVLPMAFHFVVSIITYIRFGCSIIIGKSFTASAMLDDIIKHRATLIYASPMHIRLLSQDDSRRLIPSVRTVISTSTGISPVQCDEFYKRYSKKVTQAYGIIEIGLPVINYSDDMSALGYAAPGYEVNILDDSGHPVDKGVIGDLVVRGPGMLDAYLSPPQLRHQLLQHGYFYTGDLASRRADGLIFLEGRKKSMINVSGNKVFPEEVENILNLHPDIKLSKVSGYPHPLLGEAVMAEVIMHADKKIPDIESIRKFCKSNLAAYKVPQKIIMVADIPVTNSGKIVRD